MSPRPAEPWGRAPRAAARLTGARGIGAGASGRRWLPALLLLAMGLSACGPRVPFPTRPSWESLPSGSPLRSRTLSEADAWLRHYVMFGQHEEVAAAFAGRSPIAPGDPLLRSLQQGVALHEAGEYQRSNVALAAAEVEAERRYTRSLSREAASILLNDRVLAYTPPAGELAMIPYYRMLNYLALGELDGALVESRKANALLARLEREPTERCKGDLPIQYLAGLVQRSAGELNDALVSLRLAERALAACGDGAGPAAESVARDLHQVARAAGVIEVADTIAERYGLQTSGPALLGDGELLVLVEHGFVAHRTEGALHIPIPDGDLDRLDRLDDDGLARFAASISTDLMLGQGGDRPWNRRRYYHRRSGWADALDGAYILRLAWPVYRLEANRPRAVRVQVGEVTATPAEVGNVSLVMREELARERPAMLTRLVVRGLTKYLVSRELEEATEEKHGEAAGFVLGRLANLAGNQLERADTRSWTLLPDRISLVRMRLPAGVHPLRLEVVGEDGERRVRDLGQIRIEPGRLNVLRERVWTRDREAQWDEEFDRIELWEGDGGEVEPLEDAAPQSVAADTTTTDPADPGM